MHCVFLESKISNLVLPARFADTRDHTLVCVFAEANTAQPEITHKASSTTASKTSIFLSRRKLWLFERTNTCRCFCHKVYELVKYVSLFGRFLVLVLRYLTWLNKQIAKEKHGPNPHKKLYMIIAEFAKMSMRHHPQAEPSDSYSSNKKGPTVEVGPLHKTFVML